MRALSSGPWHWKQLPARIGRTSREKSTARGVGFVRDGGIAGRGRRTRAEPARTNAGGKYVIGVAPFRPLIAEAGREGGGRVRAWDGCHRYPAGSSVPVSRRPVTEIIPPRPAVPPAGRRLDRSSQPVKIDTPSRVPADSRPGRKEPAMKARLAARRCCWSAGPGSRHGPASSCWPTVPPPPSPSPPPARANRPSRPTSRPSCTPTGASPYPFPAARRRGRTASSRTPPTSSPTRPAASHPQGIGDGRRPGKSPGGPGDKPRRPPQTAAGDDDPGPRLRGRGGTRHAGRVGGPRPQAASRRPRRSWSGRAASGSRWRPPAPGSRTTRRTDLAALLTDFEQQVPRDGSRVLIGFTSQRTPEGHRLLPPGRHAPAAAPVHPHPRVDAADRGRSAGGAVARAGPLPRCRPQPGDDLGDAAEARRRPVG